MLISSLSASSTRKVVLKGDNVEVGTFNEFFSNSADDIEILKSAIDNLSQSISISANEFKSKTDDISVGIKKLSGSLDVFALYSSLVNGDILGVTETFNTLDNVIKADGSLTVDTAAGVITLPQTAIKPLDLTKATVAQTGNGAFTDNHGLSALLDGDITSYMQYAQTGGDKLYMQLDIKLPNLDILNNISLLENNFGQTNWLTLEEFSVSIDGKSYTPILQNYLLKADNNNFSSAFSFSFIPKKVQYVRIGISQSHTDINDGRTFNIGLCELSLNRISYSTSGSIQIKKDITSTGINSLSLHLADAVYDNIALKTHFQVSLDGSQWLDISPVQDNSSAEIVSVNQPLKTDFTSIWLKIFFDRVSDQDAIMKLIGQDSFTNSEFLQFPSSSPFQILLSEAADKGSVIAGIVSDMSCGKLSSNFISYGNTKLGQYKYTFDLPFDTKGLEYVLIGDSRLEKAKSLSDLYDRFAKGYFIDSEKWKIFIFLNDAILETPKDPIVPEWLASTHLNTIPLVPAQDTNPITDNNPIRLYLDGDIIYSPSSNVIPITLSSDGIKEHLVVKRLKIDSDGEIHKDSITDLIPAGKTIIRLTGIPIINDIDHPISLPGGFMVEFIDGVSEFEGNGEFAYSIDLNQGILYLRNMYSVDVAISYYAKSEILLDPADYDLSNDGKSVSISRNAYDPSCHYKFEYSVLFPVSSDSYNVLPDGRTLQLKATAIINDFIGLTSLTNKLLKISYTYKNSQSDMVRDLLSYLTPIIPELSIIYSTDNL